MTEPTESTASERRTKLPSSLVEFGNASIWISGCNRLYTLLDFFTAFALVLLVTACAFVAARAPILISGIDIDAGYFLDVIFNSRTHSWLSRDVTYTYGPLYQWMWALSSRMHGLSVGSFFKFGNVLPFAFTTLCILVATRLLLRGCAPWLRALYIVALVFSWTYFEVRHATVLLAFAVVVYEFDCAARTSVQLWRAIAVGLLVAGTFLGAADAGMYAVLALTISTVCAGAKFWKSSNTRAKVLHFALYTWISLLVWVGLITAIWGIQFWTNTVASVSTYRWALSMPMLPQSQPVFFAALVVTSAIFFLGWVRRNPGSQTLARHPFFLLCAPIFSLFYLQSSIVRADWPHVVFGLFPAMALSLAILCSCPFLRWNVLNKLFAIIGLMIFLRYSSPHPKGMQPFVWEKIANAVNVRHLHRNVGCPPSTFDADGVCYTSDSYATLHFVSQYIREHSTPSDSVFAFPRENIYAITAGRQIGGGILQNYLAVGDTLVRRKLEELERDKPLLAVYSVYALDHFFLIGVDGVPHVTRNPEIWFYLQSHYREVAEDPSGVLVLHRDQDRFSRWKMEDTELQVADASREVSGERMRNFEISRQTISPKDMDFLHIRLQISYPMLWHVRKPSRILVVVDRADGTTTETPVVVQPNRSSDIWVFPWNPDELKNYFRENVQTWELHDKSPIRRIRMRVMPMDWISQMPERLSIKNVQAVRLSLN